MAFFISPCENIPGQRSSNISSQESDRDRASDLLEPPAVFDELSLLPKHGGNKAELKQKNQVWEGRGLDPSDSSFETRMKALTLPESASGKV